MSLSAVLGTLSSLKSCQADMATGMDIVTDVAMDLAENQATDQERDPCIKQMEDMILECAKLDREINCFVDIVQQVTDEAGTQQPEAMFNLSARVKEQFTETIARLSDADLQNHQKVVAFKDSMKNYLNQANQEPAEELDEDIAVMQSQVNLTCPITQLEMVNPMKNKKCNHHYDEAAIMGMIKTRQRQKKKCRCPVVGCENTDVKQSDLILDQMLRRKIQSQKRNSNRT